MIIAEAPRAASSSIRFTQLPVRGACSRALSGLLDLRFVI
jgi:hypothetical protein